MPQVTLTVNGTQHKVEVEARTLLVELLREQLRLTGTHVGCGHQPVRCLRRPWDAESVKACTMLALQAQGSQVTTIEGLAAADGTLQPDAGGVPRVPRPAVRLLHARHGDVRDRPGEEAPERHVRA
jgi:aerobic-type carbon monoxide dehydrogenase small subunit (CoxS/CutS family)